ncbi:hypothetical protein FE783_12850 [Paenibacillus mesophilus]|uniref:hypothetical protein n=1 Tax=Paenibacillus mesophilus TaxID=2582849 RepID=UPI00110D6E5F|nr:hypothetical protein [Paenibacillus mesophilus]TMV49396.1 hypothetical protein FE783_12850 [Paenibacillus mesophilus]
MSIKRLVAEARRARRNARHNLKQIRRNPEIMKPDKLLQGIRYLEEMERLAKEEMERLANEEMKNARRAGRTSLRNRLRNLLFIVAQNERSVKQKLEVK